MYEGDPNYARLATPEEIEEYKRIGKPYDVSTLQSKSMNTYGLNVGDKSDPLDIYLKAEGFKEFADNYYAKTTSNFKVGSWYKYNGYYLKYSHTNDRNIFIASEYIHIKNRAFKDNLNNFTCGTADSEKELVTDLSEIQQYLPEGHSDKIVKNPIFEIGKWYKVSDGNDKSIGSDLWYVKSPKIIDNIIICEQYWNDGCLSKDGNFGTIGDYTFTEVSLHEIQRCLPDNHPDKFTNSSKISTGIKIELNSFYGSTLDQRSQFNKEEIYLLPDPN